MALAGVLGFAFSKTSNQQIARVAWVSNEKPNSLVEKLQSQPEKVSLRKVNDAEAFTLLKRGQVDLIMYQKSDSLIFSFDPRQESARYSAQAVELTLKSGQGPALPTAIAEIKQSGMRYIDFLIPGLLAMGIMNSCLWGIGYTLIDFRIKKLLRRMVATPMPKTSFMAAQLITRAVIAAFELLVVFLFAYLVFDVKVQGSVSALVLLFGSGMLAFSGLAVLIASRAANTQMGNGLINAVYLPMSIVSGIFFSYQGFPEWMIQLIKWLPLSLLADHMRMVINEGAGLDLVYIPCLLLTGLGLFCFVIGLKIFKWY